MNTSSLYYLDKKSYSFKGNDLIDLLNRISTNTISPENTFVSTLLLNEKGKILDQLFIFQKDDEGFIFLNSDETIQWIDKFTFTENYILEKTKHKLYEIIDDFESYDKVIKIENRSFIIDQNINSKKINDHYNKYRIENFIQFFPNEISNNYNPLELGLIKQIDFKKGCYTGQEIVARLEAFKKVSKYLVQIKSTEDLYCFDSIEKNEKQLGKITTVSSESNISLAIVHRSIAKIGEQIIVNSKKNKIKAEIVNVLDKFTYQNI